MTGGLCKQALPNEGLRSEAYSNPAERFRGPAAGSLSSTNYLQTAPLVIHLLKRIWHYIFTYSLHNGARYEEEISRKHRYHIAYVKKDHQRCLPTKTYYLDELYIAIAG